MTGTGTRAGRLCERSKLLELLETQTAEQAGTCRVSSWTRQEQIMVPAKEKAAGTWPSPTWFHHVSKHMSTALLIHYPQ